MSARNDLFKLLAGIFNELPRNRTQLIAIDGVDGSGKSTFADHLVPSIQELGRPVIRASVDGFHYPREIRYQRGRSSPEGFYRDSYNYPLLKKLLLDPLRSGNETYISAAFDVKADRPLSLPASVAAPGSLLLFDGIFLHRPELKNYWDFSVFLDVPFQETFARMSIRDGCSVDPMAEANQRYLEGQKIYLSECQPKKSANIVIDNTDFKNPRIFTE